MENESSSSLPRLWLGSIGLSLGKGGGVAHVARTSLAALSRTDAPFRLERVLSLLDVPGDKLPVSLPRGAAWKPCGGSRARFILQVLRQSLARPDFILYDHVDAAQCQMLLPAFSRVPYGVWVHGVEVWKKLPPRRLEALRRANVLLVNSAFTLGKLQEFHGAFPQAVVVPLTDGVDVMNPGDGRSREPGILTVGRMEKGRPKGHREILAALPSIVARVPGFRWDVAGTGGDFADFEAEVLRSPCRRQVTLHGFVEPETLTRLFERNRLFCMPSEGEGFGVVYLEAMRRGCVPVGSLLDAAGEVIGDGGVCVNHRDPVTLADTIVRLLTLPPDETKALESRARGRARVFNATAFNRNLFDAIHPSRRLYQPSFA